MNDTQAPKFINNTWKSYTLANKKSAHGSKNTTFSSCKHSLYGACMYIFKFLCFHEASMKFHANLLKKPQTKSHSGTPQKAHYHTAFPLDLYQCCLHNGKLEPKNQGEKTPKQSKTTGTESELLTHGKGWKRSSQLLLH